MNQMQKQKFVFVLGKHPIGAINNGLPYWCGYYGAGLTAGRAIAYYLCGYEAYCDIAESILARKADTAILPLEV